MHRFVILITASSLFLELRESISAYPAFQIRIHAHPALFKSLCRSRGHILWEALNENRRCTFKLLFPNKVSILHPCFTKRRSGAVGQIPSFDQIRTHDCCIGCFPPLAPLRAVCSLAFMYMQVSRKSTRERPIELETRIVEQHGWKERQNQRKNSTIGNKRDRASRVGGNDVWGDRIQVITS